MQLFPPDESDFSRNRLTHSLEVAQIAKGIASYLNQTVDYFIDGNSIDSDLVEAAALAHDLGHPPFGHSGERVLDKCMKDCGRFEGNAQSLRVVTRLSKRINDGASNSSEQASGADGPIEDRRLGLNLTYRTLAAILKYDQQIDEES